MIIKSGYFKLHPGCPAGQIVCADGSLSQWFVTKSQAIEMGQVLIDISITPEEWCAIKEQIHASPLQGENPELESAMNEFQGAVEELFNKWKAFMRTCS